MAPTLKDGERAVFNQAFRTLDRGDVIALRSPRNQAKSFVMRIVGMPGETLTVVDGVVHIDGRLLAEPYVAPVNRSHESFGPRRIGPDAFFVMGDNRRNSSDSREWGTVSRDHVWAKWER